MAFLQSRYWRARSASPIDGSQRLSSGGFDEVLLAGPEADHDASVGSAEGGRRRPMAGLPARRGGGVELHERLVATMLPRPLSSLRSMPESAFTVPSASRFRNAVASAWRGGEMTLADVSCGATGIKISRPSSPLSGPITVTSAPLSGTARTQTRNEQLESIRCQHTNPYWGRPSRIQERTTIPSSAPGSYRTLGRRSCAAMRRRSCDVP